MTTSRFDNISYLEAVDLQTRAAYAEGYADICDLALANAYEFADSIGVVLALFAPAYLPAWARVMSELAFVRAVERSAAA